MIRCRRKCRWKSFAASIVVLDSLDECLKQAEAVLITTPDPVFKNLTAETALKMNGPRFLVFDFWRILMDKLQNKPGIKYIGVGTSEDDAEEYREDLKSLWWEKSDESLTTGKMSESPIRVEIVTPVHNRKAITLQCLKSLSRIDAEGSKFM